MALLFCDGFDNYGSVDNMQRGRWFGVSTQSTTLFGPGRFNGSSVTVTGASVSAGANLSYGVLGVAVKTAGSTINGFDFNILFSVNGGTTYSAMVNCDASTGVFTISTLSPNGSNYAWIARAASLPGQFIDQAWFYLEVKHSAANGLEVRVNGSTVLTYSASLATTQSAGIFNSITIQKAYAGGANTITLDDLYLLDSSVGPGARPMNDFLGDKRVQTMFPTSNSAVSWTPATSVVYAHGSSQNTTITISANRVYLPRYTGTAYDYSGTYRGDKNAIIAKFDCTLTSITIRVTANVPGVHIRPVLYAEDPLNLNYPLTLVARGDEATGLTAGVNTIQFGSTAPTLTKGAKYWIGFIADAGFTVTSINTQGGWQYLASTYPTAIAPFNWSTATSVSGSIIMDYTVTATNYAMVQEDSADSISYNSTAVLNNQDLFGVGPSLSTSATIYAVQVTGSYKKDDANARSVANLVKSGAVQAQGANFALNADYRYTSDVFVLNPETSAEWTVAQANAAKIGYKVTV
ncbi:MAG: hypothetical protein HGB04_04010 [Chlorobiaceae bacterium]|nr:hypothetical protein [Chlorobiaceae bacterium]